MRAAPRHHCRPGGRKLLLGRTPRGPNCGHGLVPSKERPPWFHSHTACVFLLFPPQPLAARAVCGLHIPPALHLSLPSYATLTFPFPLLSPPPPLAGFVLAASNTLAGVLSDMTRAAGYGNVGCFAGGRAGGAGNGAGAERAQQGRAAS